MEALVSSPPSLYPVMFSKIDIKDGFWRMVFQEGEEWNFAYVLPRHPGDEIILVVLEALQMGWTLSPLFFHVASETGRDVAMDFAMEPIGALLHHPLEAHMMSEFLRLSNPEDWNEEQCVDTIVSIYIYS